MEKTIQIPGHAKEILETLNEHGFEAYVVGGCVRDSLLGREPEDWDITTSASPQEVKSIFGRTIDTGIQHGTVTIMRGKTGYEVTTYRIDGEYEDGRHPKTVEFTSNLAEDLKRRDFTVNAMAYNPKEGLVDIFGGIQDLEHRMIRCVGAAMDRFTEDALRILRALRFSAQLGFKVEETTWKAISVIGPNLLQVSKERIQTELTKLLLSNHPEEMKHVFACNLAPYLSDTFSHIIPQNIDISPELPSCKYLRWAAFLRNQSPEEAVQILKELKMDNDTITKVQVLVRWLSRPIGNTPAQIRKTMSQMSEELYDSLLLLKQSLPGKVPETLEELEVIEGVSKEIRLRGDCISLKSLAVTGNDLILAGMGPGKELGFALQYLFGLVLERPERNEKEILLKYMADKLGKE